MLVHKRTLGVLQWEWDGVSYMNVRGVRTPKLSPVTLEGHGLDAEEWWQVPDGTPLARKIALCYPFFDPIVADGVLVDARAWPAWRRYGEREPERGVLPRRCGRYNRKAARMGG